MSAFAERCYTALKRVPKGKVTTYAALASAINSKAVRAVGTAMSKNPNAPQVPCHRVVRSNGEIGNYAGGVRRKIELLQAEGLTVANGRIANFEKHLYRF